MIKNEDSTNQILLAFQDRVREEIRKGNVHGKMTVSILAKKSGVKESTIQSYLKNDFPKMPSLFNAKAIADALHVSLDYLISDSEIHPSKEITAETLLKNLYRVCCDTNLRVTFSEKFTTHLSSSNQYIYLFFHQIANNKGDINMSEFVSRFSNLKVYKKEIVEDAVCEELLKNDFIFNGIEGDIQTREPLTIEDSKDYPEEYEEEILKRRTAWEKLKVGEKVE